MSRNFDLDKLEKSLGNVKELLNNKKAVGLMAQLSAT